jgi:hypothetical protein
MRDIRQLELASCPGMSVKEVVVGDLNTVKDRYHNWEKVGLIEGPKPVPLSAYRA